MCIVMLRILNFSYINGKSNDLYEEINKKPEVQQPRNREIRSTILFFIACYHYGYGRSCAIMVSLLSSIGKQ